MTDTSDVVRVVQGTYSDDMTNPKNQVRLLMGDTSAPWHISDHEILFHLIDDNNNVYNVAITLATAQAALFAQLADRTVGTMRVSYRWQHMNMVNMVKMLKDLRDRKVRRHMGPAIAGGLGPTMLRNRNLGGELPYRDNNDAFAPDTTAEEFEGGLMTEFGIEFDEELFE